MGSNKDRLNFEKQLRVIGQSEFKCAFCNELCLDFFSDTVSIEHILNHLECRKDLTFMVLAHNDCNKRFQDKPKPYNEDKQIAKNKAFVLTDSIRYTIIKLLVEHSPKFALKMTEKAGKAQNIKVTGSNCLDNFNYSLKLQAIDELRIDAELKQIEAMEKQLNEMRQSRAQKILAKAF